MYMGYPSLFSEVFKFILGSLPNAHVPPVDDLVSRKRLVIERNEPQFGHMSQVFSV